MRRRAATAAAVVQLILLITIGGVLVYAGIVQATTPAPAARIVPMRPATDVERRQWEIDQLADLLRAQQEDTQRAHDPVPRSQNGPNSSLFARTFEHQPVNPYTRSHRGIFPLESFITK